MVRTDAHQPRPVAGDSALAEAIKVIEAKTEAIRVAWRSHVGTCAPPRAGGRIRSVPLHEQLPGAAKGNVRRVAHSLFFSQAKSGQPVVGEHVEHDLAFQPGKGSTGA